jgi:hypothetical protein
MSKNVVAAAAADVAADVVTAVDAGAGAACLVFGDSTWQPERRKPTIFQI